MSLSLPDLTRIAETVAADHDPGLTIVGIASSDSETGRVELLVTVAGCHEHPCTLLVNLPRHEPGEFAAELQRSLRGALDVHQRRRDE